MKVNVETGSYKLMFDSSVDAVPYAFTSFTEVKECVWRLRTIGLNVSTVKVESYCYHVELTAGSNCFLAQNSLID